MSDVGRVILSREATIKTAAVEVKALTISGKQVTLAVFRQLKTEPLLDDWTAELVGIPWGTVNYFFGPCSANHLHVVWQKGGELRRACVYNDPLKRNGWVARGDDKDQIFACYLCACALENIWHDAFERETGVWTGYGTPCRVVGGYELPEELTKYIQPSQYFKRERAEYDAAQNRQVHIFPAGDDEAARRADLYRAHSLYRAETTQEYETLLRHQMEGWRKAIRDWMASHSRLDATATELAEEWREIASEQNAFRNTWSRHYAELLQLDQLFIAV